MSRTAHKDSGGSAEDNSMATHAIHTETEEAPARRFREALETDERNDDLLAQAMAWLASDERIGGEEKYELVMALKNLDRRSR